MYICPTCNRQFKNAETIAKHSLGCWREYNPNHRSKEAPHSENIIQREIDDNVLAFFKGVNNGRSNA